jgi:hypothetical protein
LLLGRIESEASAVQKRLFVVNFKRFSFSSVSQIHEIRKLSFSLAFDGFVAAETFSFNFTSTAVRREEIQRETLFCAALPPRACRPFACSAAESQKINTFSVLSSSFAVIAPLFQYRAHGLDGFHVAAYNFFKFRFPRIEAASRGKTTRQINSSVCNSSLISYKTPPKAREKGKRQSEGGKGKTF